MRGSRNFTLCVRSSIDGSRDPARRCANFHPLASAPSWRRIARIQRSSPELPRDHAELRALRQRLGLPADAYLIGNFHSDTAFTLGPDRPKWQKGPDVFAEIVRRVRESEPRVSVLLAGPRRHWLRRRLRALGVPVFFVGRESEGDDFGVNILSRAELNRLYNLLDLCLVTSRWEGGPHTLIEACFAKTKILSTRVGIAEDVLEPKSLFDTIPEAVSRILEDARDQTLEPTREPQYRRVLEQNTPEKLAEALHRVYEGLPQDPPKTTLEAASAWLRVRGIALLRRRRSPPRVVGLLPGKSPGRLFDFLRETLRESSAIVLRNTLTGDCESYLADESWVSSNQTEKARDRKIVMVSDHPASNAPKGVNAMIVPSFRSLSALDRPPNLIALVIPPFPDGNPFGPDTPVPGAIDFDCCRCRSIHQAAVSSAQCAGGRAMAGVSLENQNGC